MVINDFRGRFAFLSNFHMSGGVKLDDKFCQSVEHAYQASKTLDPALRDYIRKLPMASQAKGAGRKVFLRADWQDVNLQIMEDLLRQKFAQPYLRQQLISTHPHELVKGNTWNDTFWGVCNGVGENHLGRLLMKIREELINAQIQR